MCLQFALAGQQEVSLLAATWKFPFTDLHTQPNIFVLLLLLLWLQKDGRLRSELVAASRWLSAMDIHPVKDLVTTAAEDCTLGVWALPMCGQKVSRAVPVWWQQVLQFWAVCA
jgi:hypothetical protein